MRMYEDRRQRLVWGGIGAVAVLLLTAVWFGRVASAQGEEPEGLRPRLHAYRDAFMASGNAQNRGAAATAAALDPVIWGISTDFFVPADYDGDGKADHAVWRPGVAGVAQFKIRKSSDGTELTVIIGQTGDDPTVIGDYDGDGIIDPAVYRAGASAGLYSTWLYRSSLTSSIVTVACSAGYDCGKNGDFPSPGDFNGDGKNDFAVQRAHGGAACPADPSQGTLGGVPTADFLISTNGGATSTLTCIGKNTDVILPNDFDGDLVTDIAVIRGVSGVIEWSIRNSSTGTFHVYSFGTSATDFPTPGDYDGDGRTDLSVWRPSATAGASAFYVKPIAGGAIIRYPMGQNGDYPVANYNAH